MSKPYTEGTILTVTKSGSNLGLDKGTRCVVIWTVGARMDVSVMDMDITISGIPVTHDALAPIASTPSTLTMTVDVSKMSRVDIDLLWSALVAQTDGFEVGHPLSVVLK